MQTASGMTWKPAFVMQEPGRDTPLVSGMFWTESAVMRAGIVVSQLKIWLTGIASPGRRGVVRTSSPESSKERTKLPPSSWNTRTV